MGKELATVDTKGFLVLTKDLDELKGIVAANLGTGQVSPFELDQLKLPAGGGKSWDIPTLSGTQSEKTVDAIIVAWNDCRGYWPGEFGGSEPPVCSSNDSVTGYGEPGGVCRDCPLAEFGSSGKGQACKEMRRLYLLMPGELFPIRLTLPPTSIKACSRFFLRLSSKMIPHWNIVARLGLEEKRNATNIPYSVVTFEAVAQLNDEEIARVEGYREMLKPLLATSAPVEGKEYFTDREPAEADVSFTEGEPTEAE